MSSEKALALLSPFHISTSGEGALCGLCCAGVHNLGVATPLGSNDPFMGVSYQIPCISANYIMICNRSKIIVMK